MVDERQAGAMSRERAAAKLVQTILERVDRDGELDPYWHKVCVDDVQSAIDAAYAAGMREALQVVPTNWCDELLSGKATPKLPWHCLEIENLLKGVQQRIERLAQQAEGGNNEHAKQD